LPLPDTVRFSITGEPWGQDGTYVLTGGSMAQIFQPMFLGPWLALTGNQRMGNLSAKPSQKDLVVLRELLENGRVAPVIDRHYPLPAAAQAISYCGQGHARGKVIISIRPNRNRVPGTQKHGNSLRSDLVD
jgi:NADPH:quinone reductase-like Zn-dependent oxidoreductase